MVIKYDMKSFQFVINTYDEVVHVPFLQVVEAELILSLLVQGSFLNVTTENRENTEKEKQ